jgi:hypothetical protein
MPSVKDGFAQRPSHLKLHQIDKTMVSALFQEIQEQKYIFYY